MNRSHFAVVAAIVASSYLFADEKKPERLEPITAASLNQRDVIGRIGVPLGHGATIEATIIDGNSLNRKGYWSMYLLKVETVDGKPHPNPPTIKFRVDRWADAQIAPHWSELKKLREELAEEKGIPFDKENWSEGYVGSRVKLVVVEAGQFYGGPRKLPEGTRRVPRGEPSFHFESHLDVVQQLPLDDAKPIRKGR